MMEQLPAILPFVIPILGLLLGFVVVASIFIVQPVVKALTRTLDAQERLQAPGADQEIRALTERVASLERTVERMAAEERFHRELRGGERPRMVNPGD